MSRLASTSRPASRSFPLTLALVAVMLAIALAIEIALDGQPRWIPKLPLALLLAAAGWSGGRGRRGPQARRPG